MYRLFNALHERRLHKLTLLLLLFFMLISFTLSINAFFVFISLLFSYQIINNFLSKKIFNTSLFRLAVTPIVYVLILQCVILAGWLASSDLPLSIVPPLGFVLVLLVFLFQLPTQQNEKKKELKFLSSYDVVGLLVASAIILVVVLPPLVSQGGVNKVSVLNLVNTTTDDANHIGLLNDRLQFDRGVLHGTTAFDNSRSWGGNKNYPVGWHSSNAVLIKSFYPEIKTGYDSVIAYAITKIFWYFLLLFIFVRMTFLLYKLTVEDSNNFKLGTFIWLGLTSFFFSFIFLIDTFREGFYTSIAQLIAVLLLAFMLLELDQMKNQRQRLVRIIPFIFFVSLAGSLPWILLTPALVGGGLLAIITSSNAGGFKAFTGLVLESIKKHFLLFLFPVIALSTQLYIMLFSNESTHTLMSGTQSTGSITTYGSPFYLFIVGGALCFIYSITKKTAPRLMSYFWFLCAVIAFGFYMYTIQTFMTGTTNYYYYKIINSASILLIPISLTGVALILLHIKNRLGPHIALLLTIITVLSLPQLFNTPSTSPQTIAYAKGARPLSMELNTLIYTTLSDAHSEDQYFNTVRVIPFIPQKNTQNIVSNRLLGSNKPDTPCDVSVRKAITKSDIQTFLSTIEKSCQDYDITVVSSIDLEEDFEREVKQRGYEFIKLAYDL